MMTRRSLPRNVVIVAFVALASGLGQDLITPVLPAYLALLGANAAVIGLIDGVLQGATNLFRLVSGVLSDRMRNRKGLVFVGYALSSVSRPLLAFAGSLGGVALLRFIDGIGKGTKDAPRDALVADSAVEGGRGRAFGFHRLVDTAGSVIGPLLAAVLLLALTPSLSSYRLIFLLAAVPGAVALALIMFGIREPERPPTAASGSVRRGRLPAQFWLFVLASAIAMLTKVNDSLFLVRAADIGVPSSLVPALFAGFTLIYALLSYPIGIWSDRVGRLPFIAGGWLVLAGVEFGFSLTATLMPALLLFAFYGLFFAMTEGSGRALIADLVPEESRGSAYAVFYTITGLALIVGGYGIGKIWDGMSPQTAFMVAALGSLIASVAFWSMARGSRRALKNTNAPQNP